MRRIVECFHNFSEGRNEVVLAAIDQSIRAVAGVKLLGVEPDRDYHRVVVTFAGEPEPTLQAALAATQIALRLIDMRAHRGTHPRLGAADVVPFVPVAGVTMDECVRLAESYGRQIGDELSVPVYLYEAAARTPARKNLADIRKGEYEGLPEKLKSPDWKPDFGPAEFKPKTGAIVTGARKILIAYNVNLGTADTEAAREIASRIRESGRVLRDDQNRPRKNAEGEVVRTPGSLKAVKAIGVLLERYNLAQVSLNLTDFEVTPPHIAFEEVRRVATALGVQVTGSEVVGLTPLKALLSAGEFYARGLTPRTQWSEGELVSLAVEHLGLSQLAPFAPEEKVIEYALN
jgi:glutamate formiminotransferase/formiminotetrahydrofolate cyclodeaminase